MFFFYTLLDFYLEKNKYIPQITGVSNYFEREVKRRSFVVARWDFREREKMEKESDLKRQAGVSAVFLYH